ncbi:MAG: sodium:solute symporter family transporter [Oceanococcus sp.]
MSLAWGLFLAYMLATAILSWLGYKRTSGFGSFALGSGEMKPWVVGITLAASTASAATFIITPGFIYVDGWSAWFHMVVATYLGFMAMICLLSFRFRRIGSASGALTIPDWIGRRYQSPAYALFFALCNILSFAFVVLLVGGISIVMQQLLEVNNTTALLITLIFVTGYVFVGGTYAHVFTNLLQGSLMIIVAVAVVASGLPLILGDWPGFVAAMDAQDPMLLAPVNTGGRLFNDVFSTYVAGFFVGAAVVCQPHILTKALYVKSDKDVRGYLMVLALVLGLFFLLGTVGFYARIAVPPEQLVDAASGAFRQDLVMTMYLKNAFPDWTFTLISVVLLAAAMSTLDGLLVGLSTITANDLLLNVVKRYSPNMDQSTQLAWAYKASHIVLIVIAVAAFFVLQNPPKLLGIFGQLGVYGLVLAALPPLLAGIWFKQVSLALVWLGSVMAMSTHFVLYFFGAQLFPNSGLAFANPGVTMALAMMCVALPMMLAAGVFAGRVNDRNSKHIACLTLGLGLMFVVGSMFHAAPVHASSLLDWPSGARVSDADGQLLYREDWLSAEMDGDLSQWDIVYRSKSGEKLGHRTLTYTLSKPYQPEVRLQLESGELLELTQDERWTRSWIYPDNSRANKSWPKLRKHVTVDLALLRYLVDKREEIAAAEIEQVSHFDTLRGRRQQYDIEVSRRPSSQGEALVITLLRGGVFSKQHVVMSVVMLRRSGRLLTAQTAHALDAKSTSQVAVKFFY